MVNAATLSYPRGLALDAQGNLWVSDHFNNRVLEYDAPLTHDTAADRVLGQPNMFTNTANNNGLSASSLDEPEGLAFDGQGRLYVADEFNNRVLGYDHPLTSAAANRVLGQPDFTHRLANLAAARAMTACLTPTTWRSTAWTVCTWPTLATSACWPMTRRSPTRWPAACLARRTLPATTRTGRQPQRRQPVFAAGRGAGCAK